MKLRSWPLLLLWAAPALADDTIYRWTDKEGVVHYTDDPRSVPKGVKADTTQGEDVGELLTNGASSESAPPGKATRSQTTSSRPEKRPADVEDGEQRRAQEEQQRAQEENDKVVEAQWRASFRNARERLHQAEQALAEERKRSEVNGLPIVAQVQVHQNGYSKYGTAETTTREQLEARIKQREEEVNKAQNELDALEREASSYGIPREWRR